MSPGKLPRAQLSTNKMSPRVVLVAAVPQWMDLLRCAWHWGEHNTVDQISMPRAILPLPAVNSVQHHIKKIVGASMVQAIRRSLPTSVVSNLHLSHSMWVSWWVKLNLGWFFSEILLFSPSTNFITPFQQTCLSHFISSAPVMVHYVCMDSILVIHWPSI